MAMKMEIVDLYLSHSLYRLSLPYSINAQLSIFLSETPNSLFAEGHFFYSPSPLHPVTPTPIDRLHAVPRLAHIPIILIDRVAMNILDLLMLLAPMHT